MSMPNTLFYENWHTLLRQQGQEIEKTEKLKMIVICCNSRFRNFLAILFIGTMPKFLLYTTQNFVIQQRSVVAKEIKVG